MVDIGGRGLTWHGERDNPKVDYMAEKITRRRK
jgi:hypothetical protein